MKKMKKSLKISIVFLISSIICFAIILAFFIKSLKNNQTDSSKEIDRSPNNSLSYIVKDFNGSVAVFEPENPKPVRVTDVYTSHLPKSDQKMLSHGIKVQTQAELNTLLEDLGN